MADEVRPRTVVAWAAALGVALTVFVALIPGVRFAYESPALHVALETTAILIGALTALLIFGRFRQTGSSQDLVIVYVLGVLAMTNLFLAAVPTLMQVARNEAFLAWAQATARFVASVVLVIGAFAPEARVRNHGTAGMSVVGASFGTLALIALATAIATPFLPDPLGTVILSEDSYRPHVEGHPFFLSLQLAQMTAFGVAAAGFLRSAEREQGGMLAWVAAGCVLSALSRFNYFLFPSRYTDYVYVGDILRLGFYFCLLVGGVREISSYWSTLADARIGETRRSLARDLHDGLAQELVFITAQTRRFLRKPPDQQDLQRLSGAADRAVAESRRAIDLLATDREQTLGQALVEFAEETERRVGKKVAVATEDVEVHPKIREGALRIAREAVMNAVRHSGADSVRISLTDGDPFAVAVSDDGSGFDVADESIERKGFGLVTMRERARGLGGDLKITSGADGTCVEIVLPKQTLSG